MTCHRKQIDYPSENPPGKGRAARTVKVKRDYAERNPLTPDERLRRDIDEQTNLIFEYLEAQHAPRNHWLADRLAEALSAVVVVAILTWAAGWW